MPVPVTCKCNASFTAKDHLAGKLVKCPSCGQPLAIPALTAVAEPTPLAPLSPYADMNDPPPPTAARPTPQYIKTAEKPKPAPTPVRTVTTVRKTRHRSAFDGSKMLGGVAMMVGAVVWFVVGLFFGYIFFYPPVLFIFGVVAFVNGMMGKD